MTPRLRINEIFHSIQGEGTRAGARCVFVRLTGCHLRCAYCDTAYAFYEGGWMELPAILERVAAFECPTVEVTGGEPLLQPAVYPLMEQLCDRHATVMIETSGAVAIDKVDPRVIRIMDIKCPSSGEAERNHWANIELLAPRDEVKFVIGDREDYEWSKDVILRYGLTARCPILMNPVFDAIQPVELATWILEDRLDVRLGLQLHKLIWSPATRGV